MRFLAFIIVFLFVFAANAQAPFLHGDPFCFNHPCPFGSDDAVTAAKLSDTVCSKIIAVFNDSPTEAQVTDEFIALNSNSTPESVFLDENDADTFRAPAALKIHTLRVVIDVAPNTGDQWDITVRDDQVDTALTCTIANAETDCSNVADTVPIALGSKMDVLMSSAGGGSVPDNAGEMLISFCMTP